MFNECGKCNIRSSSWSPLQTVIANPTVYSSINFIDVNRREFRSVAKGLNRFSYDRNKHETEWIAKEPFGHQVYLAETQFLLGLNVSHNCWLPSDQRHSTETEFSLQIECRKRGKYIYLFISICKAVVLNHIHDKNSYQSHLNAFLKHDLSNNPHKITKNRK